MRLKCLQGAAFLLLAAGAAPVCAQDVHVKIGKRATTIPQVCVSVVPASIEGAIDVPALVKEADCKGSGDMLAEYTYVMRYARRERSKQGQSKEETRTYEVYMPTLKGGTQARGVLLLTSRDGVPLPPDELEKERLRAGKSLEKEENEVARDASKLSGTDADVTTGLLPLGMYPRTGINRTSLVFKRGGAALDIHTFLKSCTLTLVRREQVGGRETLVFSFTPRPDARFGDEEEYVARLRGTIWIDAEDRIVARLAGWPAASKDVSNPGPAQTPGEMPPAVYVQMMRLPEGVWLPGAIRLDGADYPTLFDHVNYDINFNYGDYKRFVTETKDVKLNRPKAP
jgi:hypothetical protein